MWQASKGVQALPLSNYFSLLPVEEYEVNDISFLTPNLPPLMTIHPHLPHLTNTSQALDGKRSGFVP